MTEAGPWPLGGYAEPRSNLCRQRRIDGNVKPVCRICWPVMLSNDHGNCWPMADVNTINQCGNEWCLGALDIIETCAFDLHCDYGVGRHYRQAAHGGLAKGIHRDEEEGCSCPLK